MEDRKSEMRGILRLRRFTAALRMTVLVAGDNGGRLCGIQTLIRTIYNQAQMNPNPINDVPPVQTPAAPRDSDVSEDDLAQPEAQDGVSEDMSTLALHPGSKLHPGFTGFSGQNPGTRHLAHPQPEAVELTPAQAAERAAAVARGDFSVLTDA